MSGILSGKFAVGAKKLHIAPEKRENDLNTPNYMDHKPSICTQANSQRPVGGKAQNLFHLQELGLPVPPFVSVPADVFAFDTPDFWSHLASDILAHFRVANPDTTLYAVRSSALGEDGTKFSFAGLFETKLNIPANEIDSALHEVWQSRLGARVQAYCKAHGLDTGAVPQMGIVVQVMLQPDVAGVAFGMHPVTANRDEHVISAVYGLGEGLVSGALDADTFVCHKNGQITGTLALKTHRFVSNAAREAGVVSEEVPSELQETATLSDAQIREISTYLTELEAHFGHPQDIEFAYADDSFYLLQARPITTKAVVPPALQSINAAKEPMIIWDNSNIIESYPGITSPLTFSFILKMYEAVYRQFAAMMGVSEQQIEQEKTVFAHMLGLLQGRVYYNLLNWYKALAMLPGFALNAEFMERMMGVKERFELPPTAKRSKWAEQLRVANMARLMVVQLRALPSMRRDFQAEFQQVMDEYQAIRFEEKDPWTLMELYLRYEQTLLKKWKAPLVNDFFAMIYFGVLQKLVVKYQLDNSGTLHNNLLCGARDIVSTDPIKRCVELAQSIESDPKTKAAFLQKSETELWQMYVNGNLPKAIISQIKGYLDKWSHRSVGELKLETITYRQEPQRFMKLMKSYVVQGIAHAPANQDLDLAMRHSAEAIVKQKLRGKPLKKWIFAYVLRNARELVSARENLRYERTRGFGTVREIFLAMGHQFHQMGILAAQRDVFYLSQNEIFDQIKGTSINADLKQLVTLRKQEAAQQLAAAPPDERLRTYGVVYQSAMTAVRVQEKQSGGSTENFLQGLGCCPGVVRAQVRVVHDPNEVENLNGDILVTMSTDPGWITLFPTASGILVQKGSLLSHSAIVSREMGKPCVVAIPNLLKNLKTGDLVEMDGSSGRVTML